MITRIPNHYRYHYIWRKQVCAIVFFLKKIQFAIICYYPICMLWHVKILMGIQASHFLLNLPYDSWHYCIREEHNQVCLFSSCLSPELVGKSSEKWLVFYVSSIYLPSSKLLGREGGNSDSTFSTDKEESSWETRHKMLSSQKKFLIPLLFPCKKKKKKF